MNIVLGVTGGISAYKACDLVLGLKKTGHDVRVIMTENAKQFIPALTLTTLSSHVVMSDMWVDRANVEHISVTKWADAFVVYPATANIIAKFAHGIADDLLSTVYLACPRKITKLIFPAMNSNMLNHPVTQRNIMTIGDDEAYVSNTRNAMLACGDEGVGGLIKPREAVTWINEKLYDNYE